MMPHFQVEVRWARRLKRGELRRLARVLQECGDWDVPLGLPGGAPGLLVADGWSGRWRHPLLTRQALVLLLARGLPAGLPAQGFFLPLGSGCPWCTAAGSLGHPGACSPRPCPHDWFTVNPADDAAPRPEMVHLRPCQFAPDGALGATATTWAGGAT